jgi:outer membrane receptor protein involved in Fe transport
MQARFLLNTLCLVFLTVPPCMATTNELDKLLELPLEDLTQLKLTTSTMAEENLRSVPSAMTVFSRDEIQRLGITELQQLAALVPGFQVARSDAWGIGYSINNRGRSISDSMRSILLLVDGQRLNNDVSGSSLLFSARVPLDNVDRVEFIRGPGSAIYGTNALSGVINIITRNEREMRLEAGSDSGKEGSAQWRFDGSDSLFELFARGANSHGQSVEIFNPAIQANTRTKDPYVARDLSLRANLGDFTLAARHARRTTEQFMSSVTSTTVKISALPNRAAPNWIGATV